MNELPAEDRGVDLKLEASTMALYVSVVLLAALVAFRDSTTTDQDELLGVIWGTTLGLALAHFYAFRVSSRLVRGRADLTTALAQLGGASAVALLCTVPVLVLPSPTEDDVVRLWIGLLLGASGYTTGRARGDSRLRSFFLGALVLGVGVVVALVKNALSH